MPVMQFEKVFPGAVFGRLDLDLFQMADICLCCKEGAQGLGKVGHLIKGGRESSQQPVPDLAAAVGFKTLVHGPVLYFSGGQSFKIGFHW